MSCHHVMPSCHVIMSCHVQSDNDFTNFTLIMMRVEIDKIMSLSLYNLCKQKQKYFIDQRFTFIWFTIHDLKKKNRIMFLRTKKVIERSESPSPKRKKKQVIDST
jgi:hypothetical protein